MAEIDTLEQLVHERFDGHVLQSAPFAMSVHVFLEVAVHVLEHEHQLVFSVNNIVKTDDILVLQLLHEGDFADSGGWGAFFRVEVNFFQRHKLAGLAIAAFENLS